MGMKTFEIKVYRDGKWWMVEIPEIDGLTQARRLGEVEEMARSYIAVDQDLAPSEIELMNPRVIVQGQDLKATMLEILDLRAAAAKAEEAAAALMVNTAKTLAMAEVPLRDIGEVLKVSHQRVHQLLQGFAPDAPSNVTQLPKKSAPPAKRTAAKSGAYVTKSAASGRYVAPAAAARQPAKKARAPRKAAAARKGPRPKG